jgi:hypothetical protein
VAHHTTHNAQTKHSTQSYTYNKGYITHNEYNTHKNVKLSRNRPIELSDVIRLSFIEVSEAGSASIFRIYLLSRSAIIVSMLGLLFYPVGKEVLPPKCW